MMIHMVFKVARTMAPSVIYIDEAEKVFLSDKKKLKEYNSQVWNLKWEVLSHPVWNMKLTRGVRQQVRSGITSCNSVT